MQQPDMEAQVLKARKDFAIALIVTLAFGVAWGLACQGVSELERGAVQSARVWFPVAWAYQVLGFRGTLGVGLVVFACLAGATFKAWSARQRVQAQVGDAAFHRIGATEHADAPAFLRPTDAAGRYPASTKILYGVLAAVPVVAFIAYLAGWWQP